MASASRSMVSTKRFAAFMDRSMRKLKYSITGGSTVSFNYLSLQRP